MNRREFISAAGAFALFPDWTIVPDTILYNAKIITVNSQYPLAEAIAIAGDSILAVGNNDKIRGLATSRTKQLNLDQRTVVPGFIDAHSHPAYAGRYHLKSVDCDLRSISQIVSALQKRAENTPPGEWVLGFKYDDTKTSERRFLTLADLDAASSAHPILVTHRGGHTAFVNSLAMKRAGITQKTPDPKGGKFERDQSGKLTGRLLETATEPFWKIIPFTFTREENRKAVQLIAQMMNRAGVTSVTDAYGSPEDLLAYQDAHQSGYLSARIYCMIGAADIDKMIQAGIRTGLGNEWVRVGAMKMTCDGSISERTARLSKPYVGRPDDFGILVTPEKELYENAKKAHLAGWQIGIHANGDVAIDIVLRIYERLQKEYPVKDPRFRIEHCTIVNDDLVRRMKALNVIPNPFSTYVYYHGEKMKEYGAERLENMFAVKSFLNAGIRVTQTSDYPPGPFEPMMALQSSVTRTDMNGTTWGPSQKISVEDAIRVGTIHGAYSSFEEHLKGSLQPGKLADLVVLGQDPTAIDPSELIRIPVEKTMIGGKWVHGED
jgi:predicted amidohydrolase YtcJ